MLTPFAVRFRIQAMTVYGYIYMIWHTVDRRVMVYIGLTKRTVKQRWIAHKCAALKGRDAMPIHRAIRRYGPESFQIATLHKAFSKEELSKLEQQEIALHNSCNRAFGYNVSIGGDSGALGLKHTPETRAKMSAARKGKKHTPEWNARIADSHRGMKASDQAIQHMRNALRPPPIKKTHCSKGHPYDEQNTIVLRNGTRCCRRCKKKGTQARNAQRNMKRREAHKASGGLSRSEAAKKRQQNKPKPTHCPHGHLYDEQNSAINSTKGFRYCKTCNRERVRKAYTSKRAK